VLDLETQLVGDPVQGVNVESGGLAVLAHERERRVVGVETVDENLVLAKPGDSARTLARATAAIPNKTIFSPSNLSFLCW